MDQSTLAVLLLAVAVGLFASEIFIPSGGLIGAAAVLCLAGAVWCAWDAWWVESRSTFWTFIASIVVLIPSGMGLAVYVIPRTKWGRSVLLSAPSAESVRPFVAEEEHLNALVGQQGRTITPLNPGGLVLIEGERMHAESEGMMLEADQVVDVIEVRSNRLLVRQADTIAGAHVESEVPSPDDADAPGEAPLDFDVPQG